MIDPVEDLATILSSRALARDLLAQTTLRHLALAGLDELERLLPRNHARRLHAAFRLGMAALAPDRPVSLNTPETAAAYLHPYLAGHEVERFVVVCCDAQFQPLHAELVALGAPQTVACRNADILAPAVRHRAVGIIVGHNHPSGNPEPSANDLAWTRELHRACALLHVTLLDHVILAGTRHASIREALTDRGEAWSCA